MPTLLAELMPTNVRYTAISIAYNTALALFGGTTPLIITYLVGKFQLKLAPSFLLTLGAIISIITLAFVKERKSFQFR